MVETVNAVSVSFVYVKINKLLIKTVSEFSFAQKITLNTLPRKNL